MFGGAQADDVLESDLPISGFLTFDTDYGCAFYILPKDIHTILTEMEEDAEAFFVEAIRLKQTIIGVVS